MVSDDLERLAIAYFWAFRGEAVDMEALFVETMILDGRGTGGAVVRVQLAESPETAVALVFDVEDELLLVYQRFEAPRARWFCGDSSTPPAHAPEDGCVDAYISSMPHDEDEVLEELHEGSLGELSELLAGPEALALSTYSEGHNVAPDHPVEVVFASWESEDWSRGGQVTITAEDHPTVTYDVTDDLMGSIWVTTETNHDDGVVTFVCVD
jgi:hypothetical protein